MAKLKEIPYGMHAVDHSDIRKVTDVLRSNRITQGTLVEKFEKALSGYCGAKYAVVVSSGTAALHLACHVAGLKHGDEAITTPITFLATANAIVYMGAKPVFADIDYETANIDFESIKNKITRRTKAVLPVHFAGLPARMDKIRSIAKENRLIVIEDACHALGAVYNGSRIGSCKYSDMTTFSFHPVKHITTGEGGCVTTNDCLFYEKLKALRTHGTYKSQKLSDDKGRWYYEMKSLGYNYRITDFQCALGLNQLNKLPKFLQSRNRIAEMYRTAFGPYRDRFKLSEKPQRGSTHAWHLFILRIRGQRKKQMRRDLYDWLHRYGIQAQIHYIPIYRQPFYKKLLRNKKISCPEAEKYYDETLSLPIYPGIKKEDVHRVIESVKRWCMRDER